MAPTRPNDEYTRRLDQLLTRQLSRIRRRFLVHGAGIFLAIVAVAVSLYYPLDRYLRLPGAVRILLSVSLAVYLAWVVRRYVLYPLRRAFTQRDVALAVEERFPELRQKLISAVQLGASATDADPTNGPRNQSPAMIARLLSDAAGHADRIRPDELLDARRSVRVWAAAATLLLVVGGFAASHSRITGVFLRRVLGSSASYPRETYLVVEQPAPSHDPAAAANPEFRVTRTGDVTRVVLAAGGDLPVLIRADGVVPREVDLQVAGGRGLPPTVAMSARSENHFKYTFRRVNEAFRFRAVGGDDHGADALVEVTVLKPPRVSEVRASLRFPAYTRRESPPVQVGGSVEALVGSEVQFDVTATREVVSARIRLLETGQDLDLQPVQVEDDGGSRTVYRGGMTITRSDRYQVELVGTEGLHNPHPGTYHIVATPDHPPVGKILAPLDDGLNVTLPDGIVPIRIAGRDDYGLIRIEVTLQAKDRAATIELPLFEAAPAAEPPAEPPAESPATSPSEATAEPVGSRTVMAFVDLARPEMKAHATVNNTILLTCRLVDNRQPVAGVKNIGPRQVLVVGETDLMRRVSAHFRRIRDDVDQNLKLALDRRDRLADILDAIEGGSPVAKQQLAIAYVEVAQGRIRTAASRIHLELMRAFNFHLFNRLETSAHAATVLGLFKTFHAAAAEPKSFYPEFYRDLSARRDDGRLGAMDKALDPILAMIRSADRIAETHAPESLRLLARSRVAEGNKDAARLLSAAREQQRLMIQEFETLLASLVRWNEFQDVITNTRYLLDQQRDVQSRTKNLQGSTEKGDGK